MSMESQGIDPYDAVLADLKAKRDQIDQAIAAIESIRAGGPAPVRDSAQGNGTKNTADVGGPGDLLGLSIADAARKVLAARRQPLKSADILEAFRVGGLPLTSKEPLNVVGSVLTRRFNEVGDVVRVSRGVWGLKEWYPNRSFKKEKEAAKEEEPKPPEEAVMG
ncbi:MAG: hypothetical protein E6G85_27660 [Alphaproteobacteria bacterium]|nr:MAG: hypothetical protein E6G85_27660 [Alphaproteobacteria bacterium]